MSPNEVELKCARSNTTTTKSKVRGCLALANMESMLTWTETHSWVQTDSSFHDCVGEVVDRCASTLMVTSHQEIKGGRCERHFCLEKHETHTNERGEKRKDPDDMLDIDATQRLRFTEKRNIQFFHIHSITSFFVEKKKKVKHFAT